MKKKIKKKIKKEMSFTEVLNKYPEAGEVFMKKGMHCIGCPMAMLETIEDGCKAHSLNPDEIVKEVNEKLEKKTPGKRKGRK